MQKETNRAIFAVGLGFAIFLVAFLILTLFMGSSSLVVVLSLIITSLLYFGFVFERVTFIVPENKGWIMSNSFVREKNTFDGTFTGYRHIKAQWESQSGFHFKYPWDVKAVEIDMQIVIVVQGDKNNRFTLKGGQTISLRYIVRAIPLPGRLVNFNRTNKDDIIRRIKARVEAWLQGYVGGLEATGFDKNAIDSFKRNFELCFGGLERIDPDEEAMGIWTGTPEITDIENPKEVEAARNLETEMEAIAKSAKRLVEVSGGKLSYNDALKMVLLGKGAKMDFVQIAGVLGGGGGKIGNKPTK